MTEKPTESKKRVMTTEQLEKLAKAREKAIATRKAMGDIKRREKAVQDEALSERIRRLDISEKKVTETPLTKPEESIVSEPPIVKKKRIMTPEKLEHLAAAREKAAEKRKALGDIRQRAKNVNDEIIKERLRKLEILENPEKTHLKTNQELSRETALDVLKGKLDKSLNKLTSREMLKDRIDHSRDKASFGNVWPCARNPYDS